MTRQRNRSLTGVLMIALLLACGRNDSEDKQQKDQSENDELKLTDILSEELSEENAEKIQDRRAQLMEEYKKLVEEACDIEHNGEKCKCIADRWVLFLNKKIDLKTYEKSVFWGEIPVFDERGEHIVANALCQG